MYLLLVLLMSVFSTLALTVRVLASKANVCTSARKKPRANSASQSPTWLVIMTKWSARADHDVCAVSNSFWVLKTTVTDVASQSTLLTSWMSSSTTEE